MKLEETVAIVAGSFLFFGVLVPCFIVVASLMRSIALEPASALN